VISSAEEDQLAQRASSMQGNPVKLSDEELRGILEASLSV
jgi:hypothetical protein